MLSTLAVFLGNVALRSLIVCAVAEAVLLLLRRRGASAATRHLTLLAALVALLVLPLFSVTLPTLPLAAPRFVASADVMPTSAPAATPSLPIMPLNKAVAIAGSKPAIEVAPASVTLAPKAVPVIVSSRPALPVATLIAIVYFVGVGLLCLRHVVALVGIAIYGRTRCCTVTDPARLALLRRIAPTQGRASRIRLVEPLESNDASAAFAAPVTWGFFRPMLLLPSSTTAAEWSEEQLTSLLQHELAHIQRGDWAVQRLAQLVCALYWFQPWGYGMAKRLDAAAECACDDAVLQSGVGAPEYGEHLLSVARAVRQGSSQHSLWSGLSQNAALGMARPTSNIEARLTALLLSARDRRPVGHRTLVGAFAFALAIVDPVAAAHWRAEAAGNRAAKDTSADGIRVFLTSIEASSPKKGDYWWAPDGRRLPQAPDDAATKHRPDVFGRQQLWTDPQYTRRYLRFRIETSGKAAESASIIGFISEPESVSNNFNLQKGLVGTPENDVRVSHQAPATGSVKIALLDDMKRFTYRFGVATGPWQDVSTLRPFHPTKQDLLTDRRETIGDPEIILNERPNLGYTDRDGQWHNLAFDLPGGYRLGKVAMRVIARDRNGVVVPLPSSYPALNAIFIDLPPALLQRIATMTLQTRPYRWFDFKNIPVDPGMLPLAIAPRFDANGAMPGVLTAIAPEPPHGKPLPGAVTMNGPHDPGPLTHVLPLSGVTVRVDAVSLVHGSNNAISWRPDGTPITTNPTGLTDFDPKYFPKANNHHLTVSLSTTLGKGKKDPSGAVQVADSDGTFPSFPTGAVGGRDRENDSIGGPNYAGVEVTPGSTTTALRVGVAVGPWKTVAVIPMTAKPADFPPFSAADNKKLENDLTIGLADSPFLVLRDRAGVEHVQKVFSDPTRPIPATETRRLIAIDRTGKEIAVFACAGGGDGPVYGFSFSPDSWVSGYNLGLDLRAIKEFRVQTRPYEWTEFTNIAVHPKGESANP